MPTEKAKVIEKIKLLLALSNSPNEAEAKSALNKAHELLVRYNMTLQEVKDMTDAEKMVKETLFDGSRSRGYNKWRTQLVLILGKHFLVLPVRDCFYTENYRKAARMEVRGRETNVAMFKYALNYLITVYESLSKDFLEKEKEKFPGVKVPRKYLRNVRNSYCFGLNISFANSLLAQQKIEEEKGLVATHGVDMSNLTLGKAKVTSRKIHADAFGTGIEDGRNIKLRAPIETTKNDSKKIFLIK